MSGGSYLTWCYKCHSESLMVSEDYKPYPYVSFECYNCGFQGWSEVKERMTLEELIEIRRDYDLEPLTELPKWEE